MIVCRACAHDNPLGTVFCHGCGQRLVLDVGVINAAVDSDRQRTIEQQWRARAFHTAIACAVLLAVVIAVRVLYMPALPPVELLTPVDQPLLHDAVGHARAAVETETPVPVHTGRLAWRRKQAAATLQQLGLESRRITALQQQLIAAQRADGGFDGGETLAATALAALALRAAPTDDAVVAAAERAIAAIPVSAIGRSTPLTRTLALAALCDADQPPTALLDSLGVLLVDGAAPTWQAFLLSELPPMTPKPDLVNLRARLTAPIWSDWFELIGDGSRSHALPDANAMTTADEQLAWSFTAWQRPSQLEPLAAALRTWLANEPTVSAELRQACGNIAPAAMTLLICAAPLRVLPLHLTACH